MPKKFSSSLNWPLSTIQIKNLPIFLKKDQSTSTTANLPQATGPKNMTKPNIDLSRRPLPARPPQPPPRAKRLSSTGNPPNSRGGSAVSPGGSIVQIQRPSAPPPAVPATLEIGEPTSVTINGVTVTKNKAVNQPQSQQLADEPIREEIEQQLTQQSTNYNESSPSVDHGVIVPATPAMANEDIPDSMQSVPPPPPTSPPPDDDYVN